MDILNGLTFNEKPLKYCMPDRIKKKYKGTPSWVQKTEFKLDRYNHLMEFLRTFLAFCTLALQIVILLKLFGII